MAVGSLILGAGHLLSWNIQFSSTNETLLWRSCSLLVAVTLGLIFVSTIGAKFHPSLQKFYNVFNGLSTLVYISARLVLLVLLGYSFTNMPAAVYNTDSVDWLAYIPFIH